MHPIFDRLGVFHFFEKKGRKRTQIWYFWMLIFSEISLVEGNATYFALLMQSLQWYMVSLKLKF